MSQKTSSSTSTSLGKHPAPTSEQPRPRTKRRKGLNAMSDAEVWSFSDQAILGAIQETWTSPIYKHYVLHLERHPNALGDPDRLVVRFDCKYGSPDHSAQRRERLRSSDGTKNLRSSAEACDRRRGLTVTRPTQSDLVPEYSEARHRAILAIRCARDRRSFESVVDDLHRQEVELLRPGTTLPVSATVSNDVRAIYTDASSYVTQHLQQVSGALHLAVDGWTSPTWEAYLAIIVFWHENHKIWRSILEFVRLTEAHTGDYMANRIFDCLTHYGIAQKVMSICLDNAPNNGTLVVSLQELIPSFRGNKSRVRCFPHVINLMAKSIISMFSPPPRQRKAAESGANPIDDMRDPEDSIKELDPDKLEHDDNIVEGTAADARKVMAAQGIVVSEMPLASARKIMFKVSGLARRVNDSPTLEALFRELVDKDPELDDSQRALTRRVATRWNTDRAALNSHLHFKGPVQWLTGNAKHNLKRYALDDAQWALATELNSVLEVFQEPTNRFSQAEVPLIHETGPEFLTLKSRLEDIRDNVFKQGLRPITRVAAEAALRVYHKYMGIMEESDVYDIAVVMCPDRKLKWFSDRGYSTDKIRKRVLTRFNTTYAHDSSEESQKPLLGQRMPASTGNIWTQRHSSASTDTATRPESDSIESYLNSSVIPDDIVKQHGGVLAYWTSQLEHRPRVARMALDYLTAPASSVDAERAFSGGRLMINHLQHQMSSRTFQAQMAVGSWFQTPLLPSLTVVSDIISGHM